MIKEDWDNVYFGTMALASVAIGALGVTIGLLSLQRSQAVGLGSLEPLGYTPLAVDVPRVHYEDGQVFVDVRDGTWHELREFVQPSDLYVTHAIMEALGG